jgi:hypothetical protein
MVESLNPQVRLRWLFDLNAELWTPKQWCNSPHANFQDIYIEDDTPSARGEAQTTLGATLGAIKDIGRATAGAVSDVVGHVKADLLPNASIVGHNYLTKTSMLGLVVRLRDDPNWDIRVQKLLAQALEKDDVERYVALKLFAGEVTSHIQSQSPRAARILGDSTISINAYESQTPAPMDEDDTLEIVELDEL